MVNSSFSGLLKRRCLAEWALRSFLMSKNLVNILRSVALVGLVTVLLTPSALNFIHSFEHEEHLIKCDHKSDTHLHEIEFECSFIQLYATPQFYSSTVNIPLTSVISDYIFLIDNYICTHVTDSLINNTPYRGPPQLNS